MVQVEQLSSGGVASRYSSRGASWAGSSTPHLERRHCPTKLRSASPRSFRNLGTSCRCSASNALRSIKWDASPRRLGAECGGEHLDEATAGPAVEVELGIVDGELHARGFVGGERRA